MRRFVSAIAVAIVWLAPECFAASSSASASASKSASTATSASSSAALSTEDDRRFPTHTTTAVFATPPASLHVPAAFTAPPFFATDFLKKFYPGFGPSQTSVEPQPLITDAVNGKVFPLDLTNPKTIPTANLEDPVVLPPSFLAGDHDSNTIVSPTKNLSTPGSLALRAAAFAEIRDILNSTAVFDGSCAQCVATLVVAKGLALAVPWEVSPLLVQLCNLVQFSAFISCQAEFAANADGQILTQVLANADVTGADGQWICARGIVPIRKSCPTPAPLKLDLTHWFKKAKPAQASAPKRSGQNFQVLHLTDFHLDPRYLIGSEANCSGGLCCRPGAKNPDVPQGTLSLPAPRFGAYRCDTPWNLAGAVLHAIPTLTGTGDGNAGKFPGKGKGFDFSIFTGDLTSHDSDPQLGRSYIEYIESSVYEGLKAHLGGGPLYAALGNHDTWPQAMDAPHSMQPEELSKQFEWNYEHLARLWETQGWISDTVAEQSKKTYSAYSTITPQGLKIITINTDFWYTANWFNYINTTDPDVSGMLRFVTDELQEAEDKGQRAWIIGHVLPGWDGGNALPNQANLFYQIVDRFSPHVLAAVYFGHIHDQVAHIYYANNGTVMDDASAVSVAWVGGSITPLTNLNSAFAMYEVDSKTFDIMEAYTWFSNVSSFPELDHQTKVGPSYQFEYSAREEYGRDFNWPKDAPLNATWWHRVSESLEKNPSLVEQWTRNQGRQSTMTGNCTSTECQAAKVCYMRSGSPPLAARCPKGFGSVQG